MATSDANRSAGDVLADYLRAHEEKNLELLVSCWDDNVEITHIFRPSLSWSGIDTYRRAWEAIYRTNAKFGVLSSGVVGNTIYLEMLHEGTEGTMVPTCNVLEVENGKIRRGRVYLAEVVRDDVSMDQFAANTFAGD
jgi:hypothetical protein